MAQSNGDLLPGLERLRTYWDGRARSALDDLEKLEWSHRRTQLLRFEAFLLHHDLAGSSVLDVGCGLADLYAHLRRREIPVDYTGYDLSPEMIRHCRARYPGLRFEAGDFLTFEPTGRFDFTVAFGIHNIRVPGVRHILERVTRRQFELSTIAAHVSVLSDRDTYATHIQAWRAEEILGLALAITPYVALRHDYLRGDIGVTLYRKPVTARDADLLLAYDE